MAQLEGFRVGMLAADGTEQVEVTTPRDALRQAGATVHVLSPDGRDIRGHHYIEPGDMIPVDGPIDGIRTEDLDALLLPGGLGGPDTLRKEQQAVRLVREVSEAGRPVGIICHGPWLLIDADVLGGRALSCVPQLSADVTNAGAHYVDANAHVDRSGPGLLTSGRDHNTARDFATTVVAEFAAAR